MLRCARCFSVPARPCLVFFLNRVIYSTPLYAVLGRQPQGRGAHCHAYSPSPSGFSPPVPHFPSSPSPLGHGAAILLSHDAPQNGNKPVLRRKSWKQSKADVSPKERGELWKRERERNPYCAAPSTQIIIEPSEQMVTKTQNPTKKAGAPCSGFPYAIILRK